MATGLSIHIGLNHVNPAAYGGWDGALAGCINDARDMQRIADGLGYRSLLLVEHQATSARVVQELGLAARRLTSGDILLVTYSGHGGQTPDVNGDEADGQDETWVLWDRQLVDDELYALWSRFAPGVRIVLLSDSCHSGTVLRMREAPPGMETSPRLEAVRTMPLDVREALAARDAAGLATAQWVAGPAERAPVQASVLLISGCMDHQLSLDGAANGLFTEKLKQVWNSGGFTGDYRSFHAAIVSRMPASQTPHFATAGVPHPRFEAQRPFTRAAPSESPTVRPTVRYGDSGPHVLYLQQRLSAWGDVLLLDGEFGPTTHACVLNFQRVRGLMADGVVGPLTWRALEGRAPMSPDVSDGAEQPAC
ncbi:caspase family protein [Archangium primigenium]|uniref:caspase family protein n=1 Tax=[Archangium] primigenium TaxID=2792470 RepID=UPI0019597DFC|nr:caspase family protein [Archangium primigenium]MBM7116854.1 caspase family protein [Archangium primigenium]